MHDNPRQYSADTAVSSAGAIGGLGVLTIAVNYTLNLLKRRMSS